ncbi:hypothetical protein CH330_04800 [candidate division WOR-3 bacterium JGI_Cruoil_03_51_56]|uniref:Uncharacterized protein n=1 Tax=candidate division WOR-3 bacterium JGI_Cruoil_03_51_56 TaxID=1973747 RepID=A0A235BTA3_UNCW3|nr:MAG: hypothetical protein CH330_04800 [candidate division WOR-3 bacterium JGI_Cruoil_03_51_56]
MTNWSNEPGPEKRCEDNVKPDDLLRVTLVVIRRNHIVAVGFGLKQVRLRIRPPLVDEREVGDAAPGTDTR